MITFRRSGAAVHDVGDGAQIQVGFKKTFHDWHDRRLPWPGCLPRQKIFGKRRVEANRHMQSLQFRNQKIDDLEHFGTTSAANRSNPPGRALSSQPMTPLPRGAGFLAAANPPVLATRDGRLRRFGADAFFSR